MKHILITLFSLLSLSTFATDKVEFFARYECAKENIIAGDSIKVNLVLYCDQPFESANCTTKTIKVKGGHSRTIDINNRQQQRVKLSKGIYYAILWQGFVVGSDEVGNIKFPEVQFDASFVIYENDNSYDPFFDPFGFFGNSRRKSHTVKAKGKADSYTLPVIEKPKRSTQEVISSGGRVC